MTLSVIEVSFHPERVADVLTSEFGFKALRFAPSACIKHTAPTSGKGGGLCACERSWCKPICACSVNSGCRTATSGESKATCES